MSDTFTIKVFYRGHWCPWCIAYLNDFNGQLDAIKARSGSLVAITAHTDDQAAAQHGLNFDVVVDEANNEARKYDIVVTPKEDSPLASADGVYPNGMVQPGVVIEDANGAILYRWASAPSAENFGGAKDRPLVADIMGALDHILEHGAAPSEFTPMSFEHLEAGHPAQHKIVMDYLASIGR